MNAIDVLDQNGLIAAKLARYEHRPQQLEMAAAVEKAFDEGKHLLVEAGTGVGKSFAYLVPAILRAVDTGKRVVISTHTIALQEQLVDKDIPFLKSVLPFDFTAVLVKGRSNYLGLRRLARASAGQRQLFDTGGQLNQLHSIEDWAYKTIDGSLSDLPRRPDPGVWDRVRSDPDDCLGRKCQQFKRCFFQRARREAAGANLLIVNHAMLCSDLAVRRDGASILPDYRYVVLDEAHTIEQVATDHLGMTVSDVQVRMLLNGLHNQRSGKGILASKPGRKFVPAVQEAYAKAESYFGDLTRWHEEYATSVRRLHTPPPVDETASHALIDLKDVLHDLREEIDDDERRLELEGMRNRCGNLAGAIAAWHEQTEEGFVYWLDAGQGPRRRVSLNACPIVVGPALKALLFDAVDSVTLTSATLTTEGSSPFDYIAERVGVGDAESSKLGSPFNFKEQLRVYVEADMPEPSDAQAFLSAACDAIEKYVLKTDGRAFVLFTSHDMLRKAAGRMGAFFKKHDMPLLVQGAGLPRSMMLSEFRRIGRSVLFGTDTFWAGVDVPGDALGNVIIVKLPFAAPNHPTIEARIEYIRQAGGNPFMDFQLPEAILKFRQGVGRLIRTQSDKGIVVILDPRARTKPYGKKFLSALPPCEIVTVTNKNLRSPSTSR